MEDQIGRLRHQFHHSDQALPSDHNGPLITMQTALKNTADNATIHYTCPGSGHGRTTILVETPRLFHLQSQGIAGGAPFDFDYEVRRVGACAAKTIVGH